MSLYTLSPVDDSVDVQRPMRVEVRQVTPGGKTAERTVAVIEERFGGTIAVLVAPSCTVETMPAADPLAAETA